LIPPAFTKSRENINKALTGYKEINLRGYETDQEWWLPCYIKLHQSCFTRPFLQTIDAAAKDARKKIRQVSFQAQASDHPIIWGMENTNYLKFLIVEVTETLLLCVSAVGDNLRNYVYELKKR
jgi:23S rRNA (cytosine1962-C5)-methyltransferase